VSFKKADNDRGRQAERVMTILNERAPEGMRKGDRLLLANRRELHLPPRGNPVQVT
jgi:hypothetical protein